MNEKITKIEEENDVVVCDHDKFLFNLRYLEFRISQNPRLSPRTVENLVRTSGLCSADQALLMNEGEKLLYPVRRGRPILSIRT